MNRGHTRRAFSALTLLTMSPVSRENNVHLTYKHTLQKQTWTGVC